MKNIKNIKYSIHCSFDSLKISWKSWSDRFCQLRYKILVPIWYFTNYAEKIRSVNVFPDPEISIKISILEPKFQLENSSFCFFAQIGNFFVGVPKISSSKKRFLFMLYSLTFEIFYNNSIKSRLCNAKILWHHCKLKVKSPKNQKWIQKNQNGRIIEVYRI